MIRPTTDLTQIKSFPKILSILKNSRALLIDVVELSSMDRPPDAADDKENQHHGKRHQQIENIHQSNPSSLPVRDKRKALSTTNKELLAIPMPANHAGNIPTTASGTHTAL